MSAKRRKKSSVRPCTQGCGFSLHEKAVALQDPLLSGTKDPASSGVSDGEDLLVGVPAFSWADHMEGTEDLADVEPGPSGAANQLQLEADTCPEDDDILDIGLDVHGLSEEEQEDMSSDQLTAADAPVNVRDNSFLALCRRAADKLEVEWPSPPPAQKRSRFAGFFLPPEPTAVKNVLPLFPDFVAELTSTWNKPLSTRVTVPGSGQFMDLDGAEKAGLVNPPPMEPSLAAYLAPSHNQGVGSPAALPSKPCRFSAAQLEKIYRAQAGTARALSSVTMLQTYQAMCLAEIGSLMPPDNPLAPLLDEVRVATDYMLRVSRCAALSLGRGMASTVVAQRHLWLTLSNVPDRDRAVYLDEPVSAEGLFGQSLEAIQERFELRKKQTEALRSVIPRREVKVKQSAGSRTASPPPPSKKPLSGQGPQQGKQKAPGQPPRRPAWGKGPPQGFQGGSAPNQEKPASS